MANELTVKCSIQYDPSADNQSSIPEVELTKTLDMSGTAFLTGVVEAGTSEVSLDFDTDFTGLASVGYMMLRNLDDTNFITYGVTTGVYTGKLKAGEFCMFRLNTTDNSLFIIADTAACDMQYWVFED